MREAGELVTSLVLLLSFQGGRGRLLVAPLGPASVDAAAGANATLSVRFSGAADPVLTWFRGALPVLTWTAGSAAPPDVAQEYRGALEIGPGGSLTFVRVRPDHAGNYSLELTKSGLGTARVDFSLQVWELLRAAVLTAEPVLVQEGSERLELRFDPVPEAAEVRRQTWLFEGEEIKGGGRHVLGGRSLALLSPARSDSGRYGLVLSNPLSRAEAHLNVTVRYGPDTPTLWLRPPRPFYQPGDSVRLECAADSSPPPVARWTFGERELPSRDGALDLRNLSVAQGGEYTCRLTNTLTERQLQRNVTLHVYERPRGVPSCAVQASPENSALLQYRCRWEGGAPSAQLRFPALGDAAGAGTLNLSVAASSDLDQRPLTCTAAHPTGGGACNVTARGPAPFVLSLRTRVDPRGRIAVTLACVSAAAPPARVSWSNGAAAVHNDTGADPAHLVSANTTHLTVTGYNVSTFVRYKYTCTCSNPLGSQQGGAHLQGPVISDLRLFRDPSGSVVTLTWEVPDFSIVTGFDVQMKGPDLLNQNRSQSRASFRIIQKKPGSARSADVLPLDPKLTYRFRVVPRAQSTEGKPSPVRRLGPGEGLSGPSIAGLAAGIPCSILFLLLLAALCYCCCNLNKTSELAPYPVSRAVDKVMTSQSEMTPPHLLPGGLRSPPDYNKLQQTASERSLPLPTFVPAPPVRVATTV